jgi:uncharacterized Zn finger protein
MPKHLISCVCGNVIECLMEDEKVRAKYRSVSGKAQLRCNDCGEVHEVFLKHKIAKFVGATISFKEISPY